MLLQVLISSISSHNDKQKLKHTSLTWEQTSSKHVWALHLMLLMKINLCSMHTSWWIFICK